jgi:serine/threonine-protein kinase
VKEGSTVVLTVSSANIPVPEGLIGKSRAEAQAILGARRIAPNFVEVDSPDKAAGTVLSTDPPSGGSVAKAFPFMKVTIAREPTVAVPDVANQDPTPAASTLGMAGFTASTREEFDDDVPVGKVIGTTPAAGTMVPRGSSVVILVSKGPELIDIPNTVNQTESGATQTLLGAGFNVTVSRQTLPANDPRRGLVLSQNPAGGKAERLANVTIVVGQ